MNCQVRPTSPFKTSLYTKRFRKIRYQIIPLTSSEIYLALIDSLTTSTHLFRGLPLVLVLSTVLYYYTVHLDRPTVPSAARSTGPYHPNRLLSIRLSNYFFFTHILLPSSFFIILLIPTILGKLSMSPAVMFDLYILSHPYSRVGTSTPLHKLLHALHSNFSPGHQKYQCTFNVFPLKTLLLI